MEAELTTKPTKQICKLAQQIYAFSAKAHKTVMWRSKTHLTTTAAFVSQTPFPDFQKCKETIKQEH